MSIIKEIQKELLDPTAHLSPILLKLRFLAARLNSEPLADWVKHEAEGYPSDINVPAYRCVTPAYRGSWSGPWGSAINNAPIPSHIIETLAGDKWSKVRMRQSIAAIEELCTASEGFVQIDAANLILILQGKVYEDMACNSVTGILSVATLKEIKNTVRSRVLDLTLSLEKEIPAIADISIDETPDAIGRSGAITQTFYQTIYGDVANVAAAGQASVSFTFAKGDREQMVKEFVAAGVPSEAAEEFGAIISSEKPASAEEPLGEKARAWLRTAAGAAGSGAWKIGTQALTALATEAALRFYGFK